MASDRTSYAARWAHIKDDLLEAALVPVFGRHLVWGYDHMTCDHATEPERANILALTTHYNGLLAFMFVNGLGRDVRSGTQPYLSMLTIACEDNPPGELP